MKYSKLIILIKLSLALNIACAHSSNHLTISNQNPVAGEKVSIIYNPKGSVLEGKGKPEAVFISLGTSDYPVGDIDLHAAGKIYKGTFTIPAYAKAFVIKINNGDFIDNKGGEGYVFYVYQNNKPTAGAYAANAAFLYSGIGQSLAKIHPNLAKTSKLYRKEYELYPAYENQMDREYFSFLTSTKDSVCSINMRITRYFLPVKVASCLIIHSPAW